MQNQTRGLNPIPPTVAATTQDLNQFENFSFESRTATTFDDAVNGVLGFYYQTTDRKFRQEVIFAGAENSAADPPIFGRGRRSGCSGWTRGSATPPRQLHLQELCSAVKVRFRKYQRPSCLMNSSS